MKKKAVVASEYFDGELFKNASSYQILNFLAGILKDSLNPLIHSRNPLVIKGIYRLDQLHTVEH